MKLHMAKRKRSSAKLEADGIVEIDDSASDSDQSSSFSCRQQPAVCNIALTELTTIQAAEESGKSELNSFSVLPPLPHLKWSQRDASYESTVGRQKQRLNSHVFERYFENLWKGFSEDKKTNFTYLDCLWFSLYRNQSTKTKVLMWIKKKNIFSRKYVFVPIVCWKHWSLLILCHLGENLESKTRTPCMLLLDSLEMTKPTRLEPEIRKFLLDIYRVEERPEREDLILKMPLLVPKVPQQRNGEDCGIFVLYFINLFVEEAPENFSICEGYPYFMKDNWFSSEHFENFCKDVRSSCWLSRTKRMKNKDQRQMEEIPHGRKLNQVKKDKSIEGEGIFRVKHICMPLAKRTRTPTACEIEKAKHSAQMLKTEKPSFMVVMKPSYLRKGLNVPLAFAREHFVERVHNVTLQLPNGRTWFVRFYFCKIKAHLSRGWNTFVQENMLENGDCCVFELSKVGEIEFKVSIFRVAEKVAQPGSSERTRRPMTTCGRKNAKHLAQMLKTKPPSFMVVMKPSYLRKGLNVPLAFAREHFVEGVHNVTLQLPNGRTWFVRFYFCEIKALLSGGWNTFVQENMLENGDCCVFELLKVGEIEIKVSIFRVVEKVVQPGSSVVVRRKPSKISENKATCEARNFKSTNPFFEVYMHPSYAERSYLNMRNKFVKRHLTNTLQGVILQDAEGRKWPIRFSISKNGNCRLGCGWAKFAKTNNIEEGDVCVFELIERKEAVFKVSILRSH